MAKLSAGIEENDVPSETTGLLSSQSTTPPPSVDLPSAELLDAHRRKKSNSHVILLTSTILLFLTLGTFLQLAPFARIYESIICSDYYRAHDPSVIDGNGKVDERLCKIAPIQAELVTVQGGQMLFDSIVGGLLALPYGMLSDRYGRKPVVILSIFGLIMTNFWLLGVCK